MALGLIAPQIDVSLLLPSIASLSQVKETPIVDNQCSGGDISQNDVSPTSTVINSPGSNFHLNTEIVLTFKSLFFRLFFRDLAFSISQI